MLRTFAVLLTLCGTALSQENPPNEPTQPPARNQRGTDQEPLTIKILPAPETAQQAEKTESERKQKAIIDEKLAFETQRIADYTDRLAWFTLCLFFVAVGQVGLFWWQLRYMRQGLKDTQIATTAAKDSVIAQTNEFRAAHRPEIRIKHLVLADEIWDGKPIIVNLTCVNHGTCDATLCQLGLKYFVVKKGADLPINTAISHVREFGGAKLVCGRNFPIPDINVCRILTPEESIDIREGRSELYCVGWISFLDDAERMRITGFCRVLCFLQDAWADLKYCRFRRFDDPDYEYED